jgi:hypothetical protein
MLTVPTEVVVAGPTAEDLSRDPERIHIEILSSFER